MNDEISYILPNAMRKQHPQFRKPLIPKSELPKRKGDPKDRELITKYRKGLIWKDI
jgi:hypothetical protein